MQDFRNLEAWKRAHALVLRIYRETQRFPREETFGLTMQLRRASAAVPMTVAEGCGRMSGAEFAVDLRKSVAAANELEYIILLASDLGLFAPGQADQLTQEAIEVRKMILGLLRKL